MNELCFEAVSHAELSRQNITFGPRNHAVLGNERDGTSTLVKLAAGLARPSAGRVTLNGVGPWSNARARRSIASLSADEPLLPARNAHGALALALRARGDARSASTVLDAAGLSHLAERRAADLTARDSRAIALALALSHPEPALVVLHEPLALVGALSEALIVSALRAFAARGVIVLSTASRLQDVARLGAVASALDRGFWLDSAHAEPPLPAITLRVHTTEPRRLAALLSESAGISEVQWAGGAELLVRGSELERVAHSVVASARAEGIRIDALKQDPPPLQALAAARATHARANLARSADEPAHSASEVGSA